MVLNRTKGAVRGFIAFALVSSMFSLSLAAYPSSTSADVVSVNTLKVLGTPSSSCAPLSAHSFTPYVYDGALHSFEFSVSNSSYVALSGMVGDYSVPIQLMTRISSVGGLRIHVDLPTTPVSGKLPISITLLSAEGSALCMSTVTMEAFVASPGAQTPIVTPIPVETPTPTPHTPEPTLPIGEIPGIEPITPTSSPEVVIPETPSSFSTISSNIQNRIVELCLAGGAPRLWIILLAVYAVIVIVAVFAQTPSPQTYSVGQRTATILAPLAFLLAFWYFSEACRAAQWIPVSAVLVGIAALIGIYWDHPQVAAFRQRITSGGGEPPAALPPSKNTPMITPPPKKPGA